MKKILIGLLVLGSTAVFGKVQTLRKHSDLSLKFINCSVNKVKLANVDAPSLSYDWSFSSKEMCKELNKVASYPSFKITHIKSVPESMVIKSVEYEFTTGIDYITEEINEF